MLSKPETEIVKDVIARLRCEPREDGSAREGPIVRAGLRGRAGAYLDRTVIAALQALLPGDGRDIKRAGTLAK